MSSNQEEHNYYYHSEPCRQRELCPEISEDYVNTTYYSEEEVFDEEFFERRSREYEERFFKKWVPIWSAIICELSDSTPYGSCLLTKLLIIVNVIISIIVFSYTWDELAAIKHLPNPVSIITNEDPLSTLLTIFIHADPVHLFGNMLFLYIIGDNIEITLGRIRYLILYFVSGYIAMYVQALYTFTYDLMYSYYALIGASGAISGLIGAYILLYPGSQMCYCIGPVLIFKCYRVNIVVYVTLWILFQLLYLPITHSIAVFGHLAGFLTGYVLAYLLVNRGKVEVFREMFKKGKYKGIPIPRYELKRFSLPSYLRIMIIALALLMLLMVVNAIHITTYNEGKYYVVYARYMKILYDFPPLTQDFNISILEKYTRYVLDKIYCEIRDQPLLNNTFKSSSYKIVVMKQIRLNNIVFTNIALSLIVLALFILTIPIGLNGYKKVEITYVELPDEEKEIFYEEVEEEGRKIWKPVFKPRT